MSDDRPSCHDSTTTNSYAIGNNCPRSQPNVIFDNDPLSRDTLIDKWLFGIIKNMIDRNNLCLG